MPQIPSPSRILNFGMIGTKTIKTIFHLKTVKQIGND